MKRTRITANPRERCEFCGGPLGPNDGKGCGRCAGRVAEQHAQAHRESYGHLSSNPNDRPTP